VAILPLYRDHFKSDAGVALEKPFKKIRCQTGQMTGSKNPFVIGFFTHYELLWDHLILSRSSQSNTLCGFPLTPIRASDSIAPNLPQKKTLRKTIK
jgi:hypothetical protein